MIIEEIQCKTLLQKCGFGFAEYSINPYEGCRFGCVYCYVKALRHYRKQENPAEWGGFARAKTNAAAVLQKEMKRIAADARIAIGTATDPWQPLEKRYRITRAILEVLWYYTNPVSITSRSPLMIRDIPLMKEFVNLRVNLSLPVFDDRVRKIFEPNAPSIPSRLKALEALQQAGIPFRIFWCPLLPGVVDNEATVRAYLHQVSHLGVESLVCEPMRHLEVLGSEYAQRMARYRSAGLDHEPRLNRAEFLALIRGVADDYGLTVYVPGG